MIVYVLIAVLIKSPMLGTTKINIETVVFKDLTQCNKASKLLFKHFENQYDKVTVECQEKKMEK